VSEIPAHAHQFFSDVTNGSNAGVIYSQNQHGYSAYVGQTTQNAGGGGAHIQMPPASVVNFFIVYQ
jgi:microcystin-dependent protein